jgi:electron transfer flavoprotein beta subunit
MKILVPIKRVPDYQAKVKIKSSSDDIETEGIKWIVNPFDEIAVEEAIKLRDSGVATEIVVATVGPDDASQQLRYAMAMGADRGVIIKTDQYVDSWVAANALASIYKSEEFGLILMGKQSIDSDASQTGQILAELLNLPQACFASKVTIENSKSTVVREVDGGLETVEVPMPCVITTDLRLNQPRYASLPGIMKAKKKPLDEKNLSEVVSSDVMPRVKILSMSYPSKRQAGRKVADVTELVSVLKNEVKAL